MNCVFCEILYGNQPAQIVYDGIATLGIVPLNPVTEGHVIFMPRKHVRDASEAPSVTAAVMGDAAQYIQHLRLRADSDGPNSPDFNIITSIGPAATQSVFHLHLHVVPRTVNDALALPCYSGKTARTTTPR
ncbi:histidine triad (HIT) family protein [Arthrobacter sp. UYNi723]